MEENNIYVMKINPKHQKYFFIYNTSKLEVYLPGYLSMCYFQHLYNEQN